MPSTRHSRQIRMSARKRMVLKRQRRLARREALRSLAGLDQMVNGDRQTVFIWKGTQVGRTTYSVGLKV